MLLYANICECVGVRVCEHTSCGHSAPVVAADWAFSGKSQTGSGGVCRWAGSWHPVTGEHTLKLLHTHSLAPPRVHTADTKRVSPKNLPCSTAHSYAKHSLTRFLMMAFCITSKHCARDPRVSRQWHTSYKHRAEIFMSCADNWNLHTTELILLWALPNSA